MTDTWTAMLMGMLVFAALDHAPYMVLVVPLGRDRRG